MKKSVLIATVAAFGLAAPVLAQTVSFGSADLDMSGGLTLEEVQDAFPDVTQAEFDSYDIDASAEFDADEFDAWLGDREESGDEAIDEPAKDTMEAPAGGPY